MADQAPYPEYQYSPYAGDWYRYGFGPEHNFFDQVLPAEEPVEDPGAVIPENMSAPVYPVPTPQAMYEDQADRATGGKAYADMSFGELNKELEQRELARDVFGFGLPDSISGGVGKAGMALATLPSMGGGLLMGALGGMGLNMSEDDFRQAYERSQMGIDRNKLRPGETLESRLPKDVASLNRMLGYSAAMAGTQPWSYGGGGALENVAMSRDPGSWGPRNAQTAGLTGEDYVNAIADNPGAGSARYSLDDLFGGGGGSDNEGRSGGGGWGGDDGRDDAFGGGGPNDDEDEPTDYGGGYGDDW